MRRPRVVRARDRQPESGACGLTDSSCELGNEVAERLTRPRGPPRRASLGETTPVRPNPLERLGPYDRALTGP